MEGGGEGGGWHGKLEPLPTVLQFLVCYPEGRERESCANRTDFFLSFPADIASAEYYYTSIFFKSWRNFLHVVNKTKLPHCLTLSFSPFQFLSLLALQEKEKKLSLHAQPFPVTNLLFSFLPSTKKCQAIFGGKRSGFFAREMLFLDLSCSLASRIQVV